ncbi:ATP-dependent DNA helicase RecG [Nautilia profundicola AmH]|uniref:ATP-dependent DNA helicase RecG n=1 Tax=Nautilia profundicola (strain ATCC BAA-1463 / DSM 18972 / AmH) TaxID=598659 RepID=B9L9G0_NAUPA|nr:ATP-dependent DNA helicase RecG [Nautilia profundicola]ACM93490.1 ATP-dependent DNA helicase RecG [Nautilia profundicola AmH]
MTKEDLEKLKKIGVKSPLELALIKPKEYEDNYLYSYIIPGSQAFEAEILEVKKSPKVTRIKFYLKNINQIIWGVFFQFKKWHESVFKTGNTIFIRGEIKNHQIVQPKPITRINEITPIYKTNLNIRSLRALIKKYVTLENLSILPEKIAKTLFFMHFPQTKEHIQEKEILYALKWAEIFNYLNKLKNKKRILPSVSINANPEPFISSLPFKLTKDQIKVINDIKNDISNTNQARRVVIGDVGSGKTIVMLATAYMAEKSIIMCPTSILANQIYEEANKYLNGQWKTKNSEAFKITLVTQKSKFTEEDIQNSNLLIGTHALLYQNLPQVNVVMVDEQHRFGTNQRAMLEKLTSNGNRVPHYFQFSATPIPRTQALIMSSFVNVSLIKELPFKKDIDTYIISKEDFKSLIAHIQNEIAKGNQIVVVYPLVEESDNFNYQSIEEGKDFWLKYFDGVYITHGKDKNKEEVLVEFREKGNILITTTVIEVGISLPRLTTIVIVGAERLGLATLHQLRGRVGRYGQKGYCFLYTNDKNNKRLEAFANTLDGFKIAELDLEFRKSGDLLDGKAQSGESFKYFDEVKDLHILEDVKRYIG